MFAFLWYLALFPIIRPLLEARATILPVSARVIQGATGFEVVPAVSGLAVDASGLAPALESALLDPATPAAIELAAATAPLAPGVADADAVRAMTTAQAIAQELVVTNGKKDWILRRSRIRTWISFVGAGAAYGPVLDPAAIPAARRPRPRIPTRTSSSTRPRPRAR